MRSSFGDVSTTKHPELRGGVRFQVNGLKSYLSVIFRFFYTPKTYKSHPFLYKSHL